jgi:hypothetical protein
MTSGPRRNWDPLPAIAAVIALIMVGLYVELIREQGGGHVVGWFVAGLAVAALLSIYGTARAAPRRGVALAVSGTAMAALGLLSILSIGLPILVGGVLVLVSAARAGSAKDRPPTEGMST